VITIPENGIAHWAIRVMFGVLVALAVLWFPTRAATGTVGQATDAFVLIIAAMSLNLVLGYAGQISLGHSAFFGIGAYTTAILVRDHGWGHGWTFFAAAALAFVVGCLVALPALRIKGVYLALVTLAVAVLFPTLLRWKKLAWLTGGSRGIDSVRYDELPSWPLLGDLRGREGRAIFLYWLAFIVLVVVYLVCRGIVKSRMGRALVAIRDNETAAAVMGVNLAATKTLVFGISAATCALAGSLTTARTGVVTPDSVYLTLLGSIIFLLVMVVGGPASLAGPIVGGVLYVWLDNYSRANSASGEGVIGWLFGWADTSPATMILGVALIVVTFVAPFGLVGLFRRLARKVVLVAPTPVIPATTARGQPQVVSLVGRHGAVHDGGEDPT
jgi:branched-chain amino acid transport system permease protein